jgi:hypothetical protein
MTPLSPSFLRSLSDPSVGDGSNTLSERNDHVIHFEGNQQNVVNSLPEVNEAVLTEVLILWLRRRTILAVQS